MEEEKRKKGGSSVLMKNVKISQDFTMCKALSNTAKKNITMNLVRCTCIVLLRTITLIINILEIQSHEFSSESEFFSWKEKEEELTYTHYIKTTDGKMTKCTTSETKEEESCSQASETKEDSSSQASETKGKIHNKTA